MAAAAGGPRLLEVETLSRRERYQLLTSVVVPRPIGWISTFSRDGTPNLAPFSYFSALSDTPMQLGISIGSRRDGPKDTLTNVRARRAFCVNVVTERHLEAMNRTSAEVPSHVDEFVLAGLGMETSPKVDAPFVADGPVVLECRLEQEVALAGGANTLVVGRVVGIRLDEVLPNVEGTVAVDPEALRPVGRLWGAAYAMPGAVRVIPRPR